MIIVSIAPEKIGDDCIKIDWYSPYFCAGEKIGIVNNDTFNAGAGMSRGLAALWLDVALQSKGIKSSLIGTSDVNNCTESAWQCSEGITCDNGFRKNICFLIDNKCLSPNSVKPKEVVECTLRIQEIMNANTDKWLEARKELTAKLENMSHQPNGAGCMPILADIDNDWVNTYNSYLDLYEAAYIYANNNGNATNYQPLLPIEAKMDKVLMDIKAAPTYCY
jgi:hypothetical protein